MTTVTVKEQINAPPEAVFAVVTNHAALPDIVSGIKSIQVLTDGPVGIGTKIRETRVMFGREASEEMEFTQFDPPHSFLLEAYNHGAHYRTAHQFDPVGQGTLVTVTFAASGTNFFAKIMSAVMGPLMKKTLARLLQQDLADIKQHVYQQSRP